MTTSIEHGSRGAGFGRWAAAALALALLAWAGEARAQVAYVSGFSTTPLATSTAGNSSWTSSNISVAPGAGTNRALVVVVTMQAGGNGTFSGSATYNGATATQAVLTSASTRRGIWIGYFLEASLPASSANLQVTASVSGQSLNGVSVYAATFSGVDQTTPLSGSGETSGSSTTITLGTAVGTVAGGAYVAGASLNTGDTPAAFGPSTYTKTYTNSTNVGSTVGYELTGSAVSEKTTSTQSTNTYAQALGVVALNPAPVVTIGDGSNPGNSTITATQQGAIDGFTVQTNVSTATITAVTFNLSSGAAALSNLSINSNATCTGTNYGSLGAAPVSGNNTITLSTSIGATTTSGSTNLYVCGTAATVSTSTNVAGTISSVAAGGYSFIDNDTASSTLTVVPPIITIGTGTDPANTVTDTQTAAIDAFTLTTNASTATVTQINVTLTNYGALSSVFLYNNASCTGGSAYGSAVTPTSNSVSFTGLSIGASTTATSVWVCGTAAAVSSSTAVTAVVASAVTSTTGFVFTNNDTAGTLTVTPPIITIGTGSDPANTVLAGQTAAVDAFTLATNVGAATVTQVNVTLTSPTALSSVFLYSTSTCTGGTRYGSAATPAASVTFSGLSLSATTAATGVWVCGTATTVGSTTNVTAVVASAVTGTAGYVFVDNDTAGTLVVAVPTITVATGSDPSNTAINGQTAAIDAFALATNTGSATVTSIGVNLTNPSALTSVFLYSNANCTGGTQLGAAAAPASSVTFSGLSIALTTSATSAWVCGAAGSVSASTSVTAVVSSATTSTSGYTVTDSDSAGTLTVNPPSSAVTLSDPGTQPSSTNVTAGTQNYVVGKIALTASPNSVGLTGLNLQNTGTAVPGADIQGVMLFTWSGTACTTTAVASTTSYSSSLGRWVFAGSPVLSVPTTSTTYCVGIDVSSSAKAGNTFKMSVASAGLSVASPNTVSGSTTVATAGTFTIAAGPTQQEGNASSSAPLVLLLNPGDGQTVSQTAGFRVQVQAFHPPSTGGGTDGVSKISTLTLSVDGGAAQSFLSATSPDGHLTNYDALVGPNAALFQITLKSLSAGTHTLQATASDGTNTTKSRKIVVNVVATTAAGDGNLLVRDNASQMCTDCHAVKTHSSQATMPTNTTVQKYGAWGMSCRDCHTPHRTPNIYVVKPNINPPNITTTYLSQVAIKFSTTTGDSGTSTASQGSFVNSDGSGPCQACHTRTANPIGGAARWRSPVVGGNADSHYTVAAGTETCTDCHSHTGGFAGAESQGGVKCSGCHSGTWKNMNGTISNLTAHFIGSVKGTNDSPADSTTQAWNVANFASAVPAASRSCVGMCHGDHIHDLTSGSTLTTQHLYNGYVDASTYATRQDATGSAAQTKSTATRTRMDFDPSQTSGGLCISCHLNAADASRPAIDKTKYIASAHDGYTTSNGTTTYGWQYNLHDGSVFLRDCTKCHSSPTEGTTPSASGSGVQGPHFSANPSLLAGKVQGGATTGAGTLVCYNCHGNGTTGSNYSNKDVASEIGSTYYHPVNSDTTHNTATEANATWGSGAYSGANRHVNCLDCHSPHQAGNTLHTAGGTSGNTLGSKSPLLGATGVAVNFSGVGTWAAVPSGNFSGTSSITYEYQVCFKCHTSWAWGAGSPPTALTTGGSGLAETDLSTEFNPANHSGHPVVTSLNNYPNSPSPKNLATAQMTSAWQSVGTQTMTCSDCHGNDASSPVVQGPHGSAGTFILKGPNIYWPKRADGTWFDLGATGSNVNYTGLFCLNCHPMNSNGPTGACSGTINKIHWTHNCDQGVSQVTCIVCHIVIPHGGKVSRLIGTANAPARYYYPCQTTTGGSCNAQMQAFIKDPNGYTSASASHCQATGGGFGDACSHHSSTISGESW